MKLEKFFADSMAAALAQVHHKLGPEAIIYSQERTEKGVQILAGLKRYEQVGKKEFIRAPEESTSMPFTQLIEKIQQMDNPALLTEIANMEKQSLLQQKLKQLSFPQSFIEQFSMYANVCDRSEIISNEIIIKMLCSKIQIKETELIDDKKICALIGPTGIGKSTTVAKLAKRFATKYGPKKLGIISTDFQRIITKNQFHYFGKLLDIQIEYARDAIELRDAIHIFEDKQLTLIDTAGVNQNDNQRIAELFERLSAEITGIETCLALPCNMQSELLNDVIRKFRMSHTLGCIMTKKDECRSIATCLGVILSHQLPIAYWCDGQNINRDIHVPSKAQIINAIFQGEKSDSCLLPL